jgi:hypothetical protein
MAVDHWTADAAIAEGRTFGLQMPNQIAFLQKFGQLVSSGQI